MLINASISSINDGLTWFKTQITPTDQIVMGQYLQDFIVSVESLQGWDQPQTEL